MNSIKVDEVGFGIVVSLLIMIGVLMGLGYALETRETEHEIIPMTGNTDFSTNQTTNSIDWQLPKGINEFFSAKLYTEADVQLSLDAENIVVCEEALMSSYYYPIYISETGKATPFAFAEVYFRHIHNGDVVYFVTAQLLADQEEQQGQGELRDTYDDNQLVTALDKVLIWEVEERFNTEPETALPEDMYYISYGEVFNNVASRWTAFNASDAFVGQIENQSVLTLPKAAMYAEQIRFGMVDVFSPLKYNVHVENFDQSPSTWLVIGENRRHWGARLPLYRKADVSMVTEHWGALSSNQLVQFAISDSQNEIDDSQNEINENIVAQDIRIADLDRYRKMRHDGIYYEVPTSYTPYEPRAFWRVPAEHIGQRFIRSIREQEKNGNNINGSYLESIAIVSMNHNLKQQTDGGFWLTEPRSNWLFDDYKLEAGFYDTRFSTDAAMFLLDMYNYYSEDRDERSSTIPVTKLEDIFVAVTAYADFLLWYADNYSFGTENGGLLVQDYFHPSVAHEPTHVSLNHLATEMNFLLQYYQSLHARSENSNITNSIETAISNPYVITARKIQQAIHDTETDWVKENNDLWYAYMPDGTYGLQDYPRLTRNDLRLSVGLLNTVLHEDDEIIRRLIFFKEKYLQEQGIPLW